MNINIQRIAREKRLNKIMGREEKIWNQIEVFASEKKAKSYDQALDLLIDLQDLAQREKSTDFSAKFNALNSDILLSHHSFSRAFSFRFSVESWMMSGSAPILFLPVQIFGLENASKRSESHLG